jgi:hypothetical protein
MIDMSWSFQTWSSEAPFGAKCKKIALDMSWSFQAPSLETLYKGQGKKNCAWLSWSSKALIGAKAKKIMFGL